jgi:hypothetical protein
MSDRSISSSRIASTHFQQFAKYWEWIFFSRRIAFHIETTQMLPALIEEMEGVETIASISTCAMSTSQCFRGSAIVATLSQQLSWSTFRELLSLERPLQRKFYAEVSRILQWSVRSAEENCLGVSSGTSCDPLRGLCFDGEAGLAVGLQPQARV